MIAIIDDDADVRASTVDLLASLGREAIAFASAEAFLDSPYAETSDCLILDQHLPGLQGSELQAHLRDVGSQAMIIVITAHPNLEGRERALAAGAVAYLTKPYRDMDLIEALGTSLSNALKP